MKDLLQTKAVQSYRGARNIYYEMYRKVRFTFHFTRVDKARCQT